MPRGKPNLNAQIVWASDAFDAALAYALKLESQTRHAWAVVERSRQRLARLRTEAEKKKGPTSV